MAKVKLKNLKQFKSALFQDFAGSLRQNLKNEKKREIEAEIIENILEGKSPVRGKKFEKYSDSYSKVKGRKRPVDLFDTGEMLESLEVDVIKKGARVVLAIFFRDEKAVWHDEGQGKLPVRRLMPRFDKGESFNTRIQNLINKIVKRSIKKSTK